MNIIYIIIGVTLRVLFELFMFAASIVWFLVCAVMGVITVIFMVLSYIFKSKPNIPS